MRKTSLYMRKRQAHINQDGCLVKKHPMAVLRECRQFNDELGTGANAKDAMAIVFAAFDRMCSGVSTSTDDFDFLAHAVGVTEVRAVDIAGTDENPMLEVIAPANEALAKCKARYLKWGKFELMEQEVKRIREALDLYEMVLLESSPRQMADATTARIKVLRAMGLAV